jgi:bacterioferritin
MQNRGGEMKGDPVVIQTLNDLLADELTAINEYMVEAEMCDNWGYEKLHKLIEKRAIDEMKHAEKLIARILFLEGIPVVSKLNQMHIGADVEGMHKNGKIAEVDAVKAYNEGMLKCTQAADNGSRELLKAILQDEEVHLDWLEAQLDQIAQMGIQNYLADQLS